MIPIYVNKSKFGKVPKYLQKLKSKLSEQEQAALEVDTESKVEEKMRKISLEEKQDLINGLQHNWNVLQNEYQKLPLLTDTVPKMLRKTKLENSLKQLERDIVLLNSNQSCIYIKKWEFLEILCFFLCASVVVVSFWSFFNNLNFPCFYGYRNKHNKVESILRGSLHAWNLILWKKFF